MFTKNETEGFQTRTLSWTYTYEKGEIGDVKNLQKNYFFFFHSNVAGYFERRE